MNSVQCAVNSVQCAVNSVQCTVHSVQFAVNSVQCAGRSVQCAVCSIQCALNSVHCMVGDNGIADARQTSGNQQTVNTGFSTRVLEKLLFKRKYLIVGEVSGF